MIVKIVHYLWRCRIVHVQMFRLGVMACNLSSDESFVGGEADWVFAVIGISKDISSLNKYDV